jgi:hypothetical protein
MRIFLERQHAGIAALVIDHVVAAHCDGYY